MVQSGKWEVRKGFGVQMAQGRTSLAYQNRRKMCAMNDELEVADESLDKEERWKYQGGRGGSCTSTAQFRLGLGILFMIASVKS